MKPTIYFIFRLIKAILIIFGWVLMAFILIYLLNQLFGNEGVNAIIVKIFKQ